MIILPFEEKWFNDIPFCTDIQESFFPSYDLEPFLDHVKVFLEKHKFVVDKVIEPIAGKFVESIDPHDDSGANELRHTVAFMKSAKKWEYLYFFADNHWFRFHDTICVIFDSHRLHAILNGSNEEYCWFAANVKFAKGYRHPLKTISPVENFICDDYNKGQMQGINFNYGKDDTRY